MSNPVQKHDQLLKAHGFRLIRSGRHLVYQNPQQKVYVTASTPSDHRAAANAISVLKRVIASPPVPVVLAISQFERDQAARVIQGQHKHQHVAPGMGSGKQRRSRGTGYKYIEKVLTAEELARNEELRQQAVANKLRREDRAKQRRADKLARRQGVERQRENERVQFEEAYRPFLDRVQRLVRANEREFLQLCDAFITNRAWSEAGSLRQHLINAGQAPGLFYEFATDQEVREAEDWAHKIFAASLEQMKQDGPVSIEDMDELIEDNKQEFAKYKSQSEQRVSRIIRMVGRQLSDSNSVWDLVRVLHEKEEESNSARWDLGACLRMLTFDLFAFVEEHLDTEDEAVFDVLVNKSELIALKDAGEGTVEVVADFATAPVSEVVPELTAA